MPRTTGDRDIRASVDRFTAELAGIARTLVRGVFEAELSRRLSQGGSTRRPGARARMSPRRQRRPYQVPPRANEAATGAPKNGAWTRETVLEELSTWLLGGTSDAAFIARHGRAGLAKSAKRFFGRFEAALNAANLELARRYPNGIPTRRGSA